MNLEEQSHLVARHQLDSVKHHPVGVGKAHSKIILMGEHAVVYDYPAIALPFNKASIEVVVTPSLTQYHSLASDYYHGRLDQAPEILKNIRHALNLTLESFKLKKNPLHISVQSTIPVGRGMGSSAAVVVAMVRAICDFYAVDLTPYQLQFIVNQAEVIAHESTSGIDTLMASSDLPVIYRKSQQARTFEFDLPAYLVVADSGQEGRTKEAVGHVRRLREANPQFVENTMDSIGNFVQQAYEAIQAGDINELGRLMTYNHYYLNQLEISNTLLDRIVNSAWLAGALGAKLTGGGLGGCVIALADSLISAKLIEEAMLEAGASKTWSMSLKRKG